MDTRMKLNTMSHRRLFRYLVIGTLALLLSACATNNKNIGEASDGLPSTEGEVAEGAASEGATVHVNGQRNVRHSITHASR